MTSSNPTPFYRLVLNNFAKKGVGFAWVARCVRPYDGDNDCSVFIWRTEVSTTEVEFYLREGGIYFVHSPFIDEDEGVLQFERYHVVLKDNHPCRISASEANALLATGDHSGQSVNAPVEGFEVEEL